MKHILLGIILILCLAGCNDKTSPIKPEVPPWHPDHPINQQPPRAVELD